MDEKKADKISVNFVVGRELRFGKGSVSPDETIKELNEKVSNKIGEKCHFALPPPDVDKTLKDLNIRDNDTLCFNRDSSAEGDDEFQNTDKNQRESKINEEPVSARSLKLGIIEFWRQFANKYRPIQNVLTIVLIMIIAFQSYAIWQQSEVMINQLMIEKDPLIIGVTRNNTLFVTNGGSSSAFITKACIQIDENGGENLYLTSMSEHSPLPWAISPGERKELCISYKKDINDIYCKEGYIQVVFQYGGMKDRVMTRECFLTFRPEHEVIIALK